MVSFIVTLLSTDSATKYFEDFMLFWTAIMKVATHIFT